AFRCSRKRAPLAGAALSAGTCTTVAISTSWPVRSPTASQVIRVRAGWLGACTKREGLSSTTYHAGAQRDVQSAGGAPAGCSEKSVDRVAARAAVEGRNVSSDSVSAATNASANGRIRLSACVIAWELLTGRATAAAHRRD